MKCVELDRKLNLKLEPGWVVGLVAIFNLYLSSNVLLIIDK